jgi:restriction system protein
MLAPDPRFSRLDVLDGEAFEVELAELFEILGFAVQRTPKYDKGADLILTLRGARTAVQAKRASAAVGIDAVRQVIDGRRQYDCDDAMVVTNNFFTDKAIECARTWDVALWDRWKLAEFVAGDPPKMDNSVCAECGREVTLGVTECALTIRRAACAAARRGEPAGGPRPRP